MYVSQVLENPKKMKLACLVLVKIGIKWLEKLKMRSL